MKRIVINTALQKYRNDSTLQVVKDEIPEESVDEVDFDASELSLDFLLGLIQQLPDRYRLVFNLYALDNFSHREIAEMLHISQGTSKSNLSRARVLLKQKIEVHLQKHKGA
jgi:RNA polymerase sigma-70 factor (ECF subfamily)